MKDNQSIRLAVDIEKLTNSRIFKAKDGKMYVCLSECKEYKTREYNGEIIHEFTMDIKKRQGEQKVYAMNPYNKENPERKVYFGNGFINEFKQQHQAQQQSKPQPQVQQAQQNVGGDLPF